MRKSRDARFISSEAKILFWPSFVDMLITTLMMILLVYYLQAVFNVRNLEELKMERNQDAFVKNFDKTFVMEKAKKQVEIKRKLNLIRIVFNNEVLFASGNYELQPQGKAILNRVADLFKNSDSRIFQQIQVEGHTDNQPIENAGRYPHDNWELSTGRSISVVKYLIDDNSLYTKVDPSVNISANGYADLCPAAPNDTDKDRAKNRRIEILIFFSMPESAKK